MTETHTWKLFITNDVKNYYLLTRFFIFYYTYNSHRNSQDLFEIKIKQKIELNAIFSELQG